MALQSTLLDAVNNSESAVIDHSCAARDLPLQELSLQPLPVDLSAMSVSELADHCMKVINNYRHGEPSNDQYGLELFHRALLQHDSLAWEVLQQRFSKIVLHWMCVHPLRDVACRYDSEENYVAQAFARFWQATFNNHNIEFRTMSAVLRYLRASLHGAILDTLRAYSRSQEVPFPEPGEPGEPVVEEQENDGELWQVIQSLIPDQRQQRVAYLLFHCHLKPREIVKFIPHEFSDVQEIYSLRRTIVERLLRNVDYIRWRFDNKP
jgi:DNA-directed RNA polymerase specialized sigma24 family protein